MYSDRCNKVYLNTYTGSQLKRRIIGSLSGEPVPACDPPLSTARPADSSEKKEATDAVLSESVLLVSPVLIAGVLEVEVNLSKAQFVDISIYNMLGNRVQVVYPGEVTYKRFTVDLSRQLKDIYIIRYRTKSGVISKRAILSN